MNKEIIERFLRNESSPEEEQKVNEYLIKSEGLESTQSLLKKVWDEPEYDEETESNKSRLFGGIVGEIKNKQPNTPIVPMAGDTSKTSKGTRGHKSAKGKKWLRVAAVILMTLGLSFTMYYLNQSAENQREQLANIEKANSLGQRSRIVLRDGTTIFLNAESKIRYSDQNFGVELREVYLEGEAYFEVAKNPDVPFIVKTKNLSTTALGTAFNVRAFNDENSSKISLAEGKVRVTRIDDNMPNTEGLILLPEEEVVLGEGELVKGKFEPEKVLSWKDGIIYFNETDFDEAIRVLGRWYNVKFDIKNLKNNSDLKGTGTFKNESLENVLKALSYSLEFEYMINNDIVTINF